jgi:hypothetical protein
MAMKFESLLERAQQGVAGDVKWPRGWLETSCCGVEFWRLDPGFDRGARDDQCGKPSLVLGHETSPVLVAD